MKNGKVTLDNEKTDQVASFNNLGSIISKVLWWRSGFDLSLVITGPRDRIMLQICTAGPTQGS